MSQSTGRTAPFLSCSLIKMTSRDGRGGPQGPRGDVQKVAAGIPCKVHCGLGEAVWLSPREREARGSGSTPGRGTRKVTRCGPLRCLRGRWHDARTPTRGSGSKPLKVTPPTGRRNEAGGGGADSTTQVAYKWPINGLKGGPALETFARYRLILPLCN